MIITKAPGCGSLKAALFSIGKRSDLCCRSTENVCHPTLLYSLVLLISSPKAGSGKSILTYVLRRTQFGRVPYAVDNFPVLRSSRMLMARLLQGHHTLPTSFSTSEIKGNRMLVLCSPLFSFSSVIDVILSATSFMVFTLHTILVRSSPVIPHYTMPL